MYIGAIISFIGVIIGLITLYQTKIDFRKRIYWRDIMKGFKKLQHSIGIFNPDVVVGLADGRIIGAIIAVNLRIPFFYTIDIPIKYDENNNRITEILGDVGNLRKKRVLVVDNHIYTGRNLETAVNFLKRKNPTEIKTLVLFKHEVEGFVHQVDYYAFNIKGTRKKMPWSYTKKHKMAYLIKDNKK